MEQVTATPASFDEAAVLVDLLRAENAQLSAEIERIAHDRDEHKRLAEFLKRELDPSAPGRVELTVDLRDAPTDLRELEISAPGACPTRVPIDALAPREPRLIELRPWLDLGGDRSGLGLGLAIAKSLVELHNGRIWVENKRNGRGSSFCVALPAHGVGEPDRVAERTGSR